MIRNPFCASVLMSAADPVIGSALAPGCAGGIRVGSESMAAAERNRERFGELPDAGRVLLGEAARESAPATVNLYGCRL